MESIKNKFKKYKIQKKKDKSKLKQFQERAIEICEEFGITGIYKLIIFKHAKNSMPYLEGKVSLCYEKFGKNNCKNKGRYLISLFRKVPTWIK